MLATLNFLNNKQLHSNCYDFLFISLAVSLPFSNLISNVLLVLLFLNYFIINTTEKEKYSNSLKTLIFLFAFLVCKAILLNTFLTEVNFYSKLFYFVLLPILVKKVKNVNLIKRALIASVFIFICFSLKNLFLFYSIYKYLPFYNGFEVNKVLVLERPYVGFLLTIGIILSVEQFFLTTKKTYKWLFMIFNIIALICVFFISARNSILTLIVIFGIYLIFFYRAAIVKKIAFGVALMGIIAIGFLTNKNLQQRFFFNGNFKELLQNSAINEPRYYIWQCAYKIINDKNFNIILGLESQATVQKKLNDCYQGDTIANAATKFWFQSEKFNTHNQFLGFMLLGGTIALFLSISFFVCLMFETKQYFYGLALIIAIGFFFCFENVIHRQFGSLLSSFLIGIVMCKNKFLQKQ